MQKEPTVTLYLRVPLALHEAIERDADSKGISITKYCTLLLAGRNTKEPHLGRNGQGTGSKDTKLV